MKSNCHRIILSLAAIGVLAGCSNGLYFGSYSRIGIDASTGGAGLGAKSGSVVVTPTKSNGKAFNVYGCSDIDISYQNAVIDETFAVGEAALPAASRVGVANGGRAARPEYPLLFGAYTSIALVDLSWGDTPSPGVHFGYKRNVGLRMPVKNDQIGDAYANLQLSTLMMDPNSPSDPNDAAELDGFGTRTGGIRMRSHFATGDAAVMVADRDLVNGNACGAK